MTPLHFFLIFDIHEELAAFVNRQTSICCLLLYVEFYVKSADTVFKWFKASDGDTSCDKTRPFTLSIFGNLMMN